MSNSPKILLTSPINVVKSYVIYEWLDYIKKLDYDNYEIFMVDNSPKPDFSEKIRDLGFNCVWDDPKGREARYSIASSNERTRIKFLAGDYQFFFNVECDLFPPKNIIDKLLSHDKDVVGTTYWSGLGYKTFLQLFTLYNQHTDFQKHEKIYKTRRLTFQESQLFMDGQCKPVYANGMGCILIKRWVLENILFHIEPDDTGYADSFFHRDLWRQGIENYVDTSIIPLHKNSNWDTVLNDTGHKLLSIKRNELKQMEK